MVRFIPSFLRAAAPTSDLPLSRLLKSRHTDKHFVQKVTNVVFSKESLIAAKLLHPRYAQKVINRLDKALDTDAIANNKRLWRRCFNYLCRICGHHRLLPSTYRLTSTLRREEQSIGSGGFADVWKGVYGGRQVAIKALRIYQTNNIEEFEKRFCREVLMWNRRSHPNILPLLGVSNKGLDFIMVCEWMENGNVKQYVLANPGVNRPSLLLGAIDGLAYLHSLKLVHGDLKGANILIKKDRSSCLADFGLATIMSTDTSSFSSPSFNGGSYRWMSPELLNFGELKEFAGRTVGSDRYAFGMVIYEVLTGNIPFHQNFLDCVVAARIIAGERPEIPHTEVATPGSGLWAVVRRCWREDPVERPPLFEIRDWLFIAAGLWNTDMGQSESMDGYVRVPNDTLLSSGEFYDTESDSESESGMSSCSFVQCSLPHQLYASGQSVVVPIQSADVAGQIEEDVQSSDEESEYHLEPPDYVYAKPKF